MFSGICFHIFFIYLDASKIVFSAIKGGSGHIGPFSTDTTIIYRKVLTNVGNAYNPDTGESIYMYIFTFLLILYVV